MSEEHTPTPHQREGENGAENIQGEKKGGRNVKEYKRRKGKTNIMGTIVTKTNKNKNDIVANNHKLIISDQEFKMNKAKNVGIGGWEIDRILKECQKKGSEYPPENVMAMFRQTMEGLEVKESRVAAWSKRKINGLFLKK